MKKISLAIFILLMSLTSFVLAKQNLLFQSPFRTIYGQDNRRDLFEIEDARLKETAKSVAAIVLQKRSQIIDEKLLVIANKKYGSRFGLCKNTRFYDQPSGPFATAFLVAPNLMLTAAHAIANSRQDRVLGDEPLCSEVLLVFDYSVDSKTEVFSDSASVPLTSVYRCKQVIKKNLVWMSEDYALIEIDRVAEGRKPLRFSKKLPTANTPIFVIGHPHGLPLKITAEAAVRSVNLETNRFSANTDTTGGNSGSPVLNSQTFEVEGIHVSGDIDFVTKSGCKSPKLCQDDTCWGSWAFRPDQSTLDVIKSR